MNQNDNVRAFARFDHIDLRTELLGPYPAECDDEPPSFLITQAIYINGENLAPENPIDLVHLCKSCQLGGEFFIVTCGCGNAGCGGVDDGIRVTHLDDHIVWEVPVPLSYRGMTEDEVAEAQKSRQYRKFTFEPEAYLAAVQLGLREARAMLFDEHQPVECSPYGMTPERLLMLAPLVFSKRGAPVGCTLTGKTVEIDPFLHHVVINGIYYRIPELPLPDAYKAFADWSQWEPMDVGDGYVYGAGAAPEWEVRRRIRLLAKYLASILVVGGTVEWTSAEYKDADGTRWKRRTLLEGQAPLVR